MRRPGYLAGYKHLEKNPIKRWAEAIDARDARAITELYAPNANLLATLDDTPLHGLDDIKPYFINLVKKPGLHVTFQELHKIRPDIWSGLYTFKWNGGSLPARFTFVLGKNGIQHHHSSAMP